MWAFTAHRVPHHAADIVTRRQFASRIAASSVARMSEFLDEIKAARIESAMV